MEKLYCGDCGEWHDEGYFSAMNHNQAQGRDFKQPRCKKAQAKRHEQWRRKKYEQELQKIGQLKLVEGEPWI